MKLPGNENFKLPESKVVYSIDDENILQVSKTELAIDKSITCTVCKKCGIKLKDLRAHIGRHILKKDVSSLACGYCGSFEWLLYRTEKTTHKTIIPASNCKLYIKFSLKSALTSRERTPCSNRPVSCQLCKNVYWSYALQDHYTAVHTGETYPLVISDEEKKLMLK